VRGPPITPPEHPTLDAALSAAARSDEGLFFVTDNENETFLAWREVETRARNFASGLAACGIVAGDRVALVLPTAASFPTAFFGTILAGGIPVPLYPPLRLGRLAEYHSSTVAMTAAVAARMIVTDTRVERLLGEVVLRAALPLGCRTVESILRHSGSGGGHGFTGNSAQPEDLALVQFSSGTTRAPRPIALSHAALTAQCAALRPLLRGDDGSAPRGVSWLPLYHDMGLIGALLGAVTYPGSLTLIPPERFLARPSIWLRTIARHRATISPAPPFAFAHCSRRIRDEELAGCDLSSWRLAICGAESISPGVLERFSERFAPFGFRARALAPAYGLAEASLAVTCTPPLEEPSVFRVDPRHLAAEGEARPGTHSIAAVGVALAGIKVAIRDHAGGTVSERIVGRIWVQGPTLMSGYLDQVEATESVLVDGWLDTGDLGFFADGRLHVTARAKDIVIVRGANYAPEEFEACLTGLPGVRPGRAAAVSFLPGDTEDEALLLLVERTRGTVSGEGTGLEAEVRRVVRKATGIQPHTVELLAPGTLPLTSSGKLRRAEALRRYQAGQLEPPGRSDPLFLAGQLARSALGHARARWRL
jgi:fatty-acyl-CoA synthase